ncbi:hypothetical protein NKR23_g10590 [Pleurostoma richardsiae]|uniref:Thioredoxin domain-containing protein n=1 Tax=Pleurostoma richardsiae TaxID=41990 RepID=A0AA38R2P3_9PEZI|nr:hypothetical protein NKR23_g10590 [Pleurostoma richardsiae]
MVAAEDLEPWSISVVQVDCDKTAEVCASHKVISYPTIRIIENGEHKRMRASFKAASIVAAALQRRIPDHEVVDDRKFEVLKSLDVPLLMIDRNAWHEIVDGGDGHLRALPGRLRKGFFLGIPEGSFTPRGVTGDALLTVYSRLDEIRPEYNGKLVAEDIESWVKRSSQPLIAKLDLKRLGEYIQSRRPLAMIFAEEASERTAVAKDLKDIALKYKGEVDFVTVDARKLAFLVEPVGLALGSYPAFSLQTADDSFPFDQSSAITAEAIDSFLSRILERTAHEL